MSISTMIARLLQRPARTPEPKPDPWAQYAQARLAGTHRPPSVSVQRPEDQERQRRMARGEP